MGLRRPQSPGGRQPLRCHGTCYRRTERRYVDLHLRCAHLHRAGARCGALDEYPDARCQSRQQPQLHDNGVQHRHRRGYLPVLDLQYAQRLGRTAQQGSGAARHHRFDHRHAHHHRPRRRLRRRNGRDDFQGRGRQRQQHPRYPHLPHHRAHSTTRLQLRYHAAARRELGHRLRLFSGYRSRPGGHHLHHPQPWQPAQQLPAVL